MENISIRPGRNQIRTNVVALGLLSGLSMASPALATVCALLLPLFACPLAKRKEQKIAFFACAMPSISCFLHGADFELALILLWPGMFLLFFAHRFYTRERAGDFPLWIGLATLSTGMVLVCVSSHLPLSVPDAAAQWVLQSEDPGMILMQLARMGLVSMPEGFSADGLMEPVMMNQMLLSFRRTVELYMTQFFPMHVIHGCILLGLFISLRMDHLNGVLLIVEIDPKNPGERKTRVAALPGFRLLSLPPRHRTVLGLLVLLCVLFVSQEGFIHTLGLIGLQFSMTCFQLLGASVMVFMMAMRNEDRIKLIGAAVGLIYVLTPTVPLMIGITDSFFHYRTHKVRKDSES